MNNEFNVDNHTPEQALQFLQSLAMSVEGGSLNNAVVMIQAIQSASATITHEFEKGKIKEK